jgi:ABC-2 type transport system ATP-binding protein
MNALEIEHISVRYGRFQALATLSLVIPQGQTLALGGPNGAGKSTLLQVLTGLIRPNSGRVQIQGLPADRLAARQQLAFSPQQLTFPSGLKVTELIRYVLGSYAGSHPQALAEWSEILGCAPLWHKWADRLSGGENKRLSLLLALAANTPIVVLDEPASALDGHYQQMLAEALQRVRGERTVIFVSHDEQAIMAHADRRVRLERGQCVADQLLSPSLPGSGRLRFWAETCPDLPEIRHTTQMGDYWELQVSDTDQAVRALVASGEAFHGLEVQRGGVQCVG